jgi:hypothetical protein
MTTQTTWTWVSPVQVLPPNSWVSGLPATSYNGEVGLHQLVLPAWLPTPCSIVRARIAHQNQLTRPGGQFALSIDVGANQWNTRNVPPFTSEGDYSQVVTLVSVWADASEPQERTVYFDPPVVFNSAVDLLYMQFDGDPQTIDQFFFQIGFITPGS